MSYTQLLYSQKSRKGSFLIEKNWREAGVSLLIQICSEDGLIQRGVGLRCLPVCSLQLNYGMQDMTSSFRVCCSVSRTDLSGWRVSGKDPKVYFLLLLTVAPLDHHVFLKKCQTWILWRKTCSFRFITMSINTKLVVITWFLFEHWEKTKNIVNHNIRGWLWGSLHTRSCRHSSFSRLKMRFDTCANLRKKKKQLKNKKPVGYSPSGHKKKTEQHSRVRRKTNKETFYWPKTCTYGWFQKEKPVVGGREGTLEWKQQQTRPKRSHPFLSGGGPLVDVDTAACGRRRQPDWAKCTSRSTVMNLFI